MSESELPPILDSVINGGLCEWCAIDGKRVVPTHEVDLPRYKIGSDTSLCDDCYARCQESESS